MQGRIGGTMQLYSKERNLSNTQEGHASVFVDYTFPGTNFKTILYCFATRLPGESKLFITEVQKPGGVSPTSTTPTYGTKTTFISFPQDAAADFPVIMEASQKYQVIYLITKLGYLHIFDIPSCTSIYMNKISQDQDTIFVSTSHDEGIFCVNKRGKVLNIALNEDTIIPYLVSKGNVQCAIGLASRAGLKGADDIFVKQFQKFIQEGRYQDAARVAADSPGGILRTPQTIQLYKNLQPIQGQPPPVIQYFHVLLEKGKLNKYETLELAVPVIQQNRKDLLEKWIQEDKLDYSDEFGDALKPIDPKLALKIYLKSESKEKAVILLAEFGQFEKLVQWCTEIKYTPDWLKIINNLCNVNSKNAVNLSKLLLNVKPTPQVDRNAVVDIFVGRNLLPETTELLLDILGEDKAEDAALQTKLLELNLAKAPQIAEEIFKNKLFSHYNKQKVAELCEKAGLFHRALEHYTDITNRKRVLRNAHTIPPDFLVAWFGTVETKDFIECIKEMLSSNPKQNLNVVVQVAIRYAEKVPPSVIIPLFESIKSYEGLYMFLNPILPLINDKEVHFKFIEAASRLGRIADVERVCRESNNYDPERVRDFLKEIKLSDPLPLIIVCDRFGYISDLVRYLNKNSMRRAIEVYVTQINPDSTPVVVGALLDDDSQEDFIKGLINSVGRLCPIDRLVEEVEKRNRLKILHSWLEARFKEGSQDVALHNAMAKIAVDTRQEPEKFLNNNQFYDRLVVGKYCESRDPNLAFIAYKSAKGACDKELVDIANKASLFKPLSLYLIERMDLKLWAYVFNTEEILPNRKSIIEHVQSSLKETSNPDQVSIAVKAFMNAELQNELVGLLERIVVDGTNKAFSENASLQNLLILTAIRAHSEATPSKAMDYIKKLNHYNASEIAGIAVKQGLYEEGFVAYSKVNMNTQAVDILLNNIGSIQRATEFANKVGQPEVYSRLGKAQLDADMTNESIESFIKANDPQYYHEVISAANKKDLHENLVRYLLMSRSVISETKIDSELIYSYARINKLSDIEDFLQITHRANIQDVGERLFDEGFYDAAKILFSHDHSYAKLALALIKLGQYSEAVDVARKANSISTWKEIGKACLEIKEFRLARTCGLNVIIHGDELIELIRYYENRGYVNELIHLLEDGIAGDRSHPGMYTELAILYAKYEPTKLSSHLKQHNERLNIAKVCNACEDNLLWKDLSYLLIQDKEFDKAAEVMMQHHSAWDSSQFNYVLSKVTSSEACYKAVNYYIETHPLLLNDLLLSVNARVSHRRIIDIAKDHEVLSLVKTYLLKIQELDDQAVNEALSDIFIEEEDYEALRRSIETYKNFDALALAKKLEKHDLIEFRRIASEVYRQNGKFDVAIGLLKDDGLDTDTIKVASLSKDHKVAENLLEYFLKNENPQGFAACLYSCYDLIRPDVALELAWKYKQIDFVFPYVIQFIREYTTRLVAIEKAVLGKEEQPINVIPVSPQPFSTQVPPHFMTQVPPQQQPFTSTQPGPFVPQGQPQGFPFGSAPGNTQGTFVNHPSGMFAPQGPFGSN